MPRLIDAEAVLNIIRDYFVELTEEKAEEYGADEIPMGVINPYLEMNKMLRTKVKQIPTVDAVPTEFHDKCMEIEIQKRFDLELNSERVVRCKDCKFYWKNDRNSKGVVCLATPKDDAFCSEGERRKDER